MSTTHTTLTEDEFIAQFQPETHPDGSLYVQRDWTDPADMERIQQAHTERRLWTMVDDGEGGVALVQGFAYVNRLYYVLCAVPTAEDTYYDIEMEPFERDEEEADEDGYVDADHPAVLDGRAVYDAARAVDGLPAYRLLEED